MATEAQKAKYREYSYRRGVDPNRKQGLNQKSIDQQLARQQEFLAKYPNSKVTLDEWQKVNILQGATDRIAVEMYYGLDGQSPQSLESIGQRFEVTKQCVDKWLKKIQKRLEKFERGETISTKLGRPRKSKTS